MSDHDKKPTASATFCFPWVRGQIVQYLIDMPNQNSAWQEMLQLCKTPEFFNKIPSESIFLLKEKRIVSKVKMHN